MTEILVYADESGTQGGAQYCLVAGFMGSQRQWKKWSEDWRRVLDDYAISSFHSKDFFNRPRSTPAARSNLYRKWSNGQAMRFIQELVATFRTRRLFPIGCAIDVPAFNAFSLGERRYLTNAAITKGGKFVTTGAPSRLYQYAFGLLVGEALLRSRDDVLVHFVLDLNSREQRYAVETFDLVKRRGTHPAFERLGRIRYADDEKELGLQLADLHAFSWHGALIGSARDNPERRHVMNSLAKKRSSIEIIDKFQMVRRLESELSSDQLNVIRAM